MSSATPSEDVQETLDRIIKTILTRIPKTVRFNEFKRSASGEEAKEGEPFIREEATIHYKETPEESRKGIVNSLLEIWAKSPIFQ